MAKAKKHYRLKAEPLGGKAKAQPALSGYNSAVPSPAVVRPTIDEAYIRRYVAMYSERQEQLGRQRWPKDTCEKMVKACAGLNRSRELKAAIAEVAKMDVEDL